VKELSNEIPIYRILLKKSWFDPDTQEIRAEAFIRKYKQKLNDYEENLSCNLDIDSYQKFKSWGVIELSVRDIRNLGLDAIQDGKNHVSITNLPHPENEPKKAEDIARKLAKKAKLIKLFDQAHKPNKNP
jgi:hypothetical protein